MTMKVLALLLVLTACSHKITVKNPANKFLSAEAQGKPLSGKIHFFMNEGNEAQVDLRQNTTDEALVLNRENSRFFDIIVNGEIGIWGPLDLVHVSGGRMGADLTGAKVQVYGQDKQQADQYNFSIALVGAYGGVVNNVEEGEDFELVALDEDTTSEMKISNHAAGILLSYRPSKKFLVNLAHYGIIHNFSGTLESQNTALDGKNLNYKGHTALTTLSVFSYEERVILGLELASEYLKWDKTDPTHNIFTNFTIGMNW